MTSTCVDSCTEQPAASVPGIGTQRERNDLPRICIVAQNAFGALSGNRNGHVGGAEYQTTLLARWLAQQGYGTSLLTWDEGQRDGELFEGVRAVKMCPTEAGLPGLRFFHPRMTSLIKALERADADIYYLNSAEYIAAFIALWCRYRRRRFVYSVASEVACDVRLPALTKAYERFLYRFGIERSDHIIVQTEKQNKMLQEGFGLPSVVLPMPCPGPSEAEYVAAPKPPARTIGWVGRADSMKRLDWLLAIAERTPDVTYHLAVANRSRCANADSLVEHARRLPNVIWRWNVSRSEMPDLYRGVAALCCTSSYEGFPNTFLEAWSHGRPVITSFDPDNVVARLNVGLVAHTIDAFVDGINRLFSSPASWSEKAANARRLYVERHKPEVVMPMIERELVGAGLGR